MNDFARFEVRVPRSGYQWIDAALEEAPRRKRRLLVGRPGPLFSVGPYELFAEEPALFRTFADLEPTEDTILSFANRYGWLGVEKRFVYRGEGRPKQPGPEIFQGKLGEPLDVWCREILWMRRAVRLWNLLRAESTDALLHELEDHETLELVERKQIAEAAYRTGAATYDPVEFAQRLAESGNFGRNLNYRVITTKQLLQSESVRSDPLFVLECGLTALRTIVDSNLGAAAFALARVKKTGDGSVPLVLRAVPKNLLAGLWLQLALAIQGNKRFVNCRQCQTWFQPPAKALRDSTAFCSTKCRVREYRQRVGQARKLAQKGKSASEIARELSADANTVRRWIKGAQPKRSGKSR